VLGMPPKRRASYGKRPVWGEKKGRFIDDEPEPEDVSDDTESSETENPKVKKKKVSGLHKSTGGGVILEPPPFL